MFLQKNELESENAKLGDNLKKLQQSLNEVTEALEMQVHFMKILQVPKM